MKTTTISDIWQRLKNDSEKRILFVAIFAIGLSAVIRFCVIAPVRIVGDSMLPSLADGDWVIASPRSYHDNPPERGDLVLVCRRDLTNGYIIKRIAGLPGETIEIIMNHADAFQDLKEYLSEQGIGFREIYDGEQMTLQFTINGKL